MFLLRVCPMLLLLLWLERDASSLAAGPTVLSAPPVATPLPDPLPSQTGKGCSCCPCLGSSEYSRVTRFRSLPGLALDLAESMPVLPLQGQKGNKGDHGSPGLPGFLGPRGPQVSQELPGGQDPLLCGEVQGQYVSHHWLSLGPPAQVASWAVWSR